MTPNNDLGGSGDTPPYIVGRKTATELWVGAEENGMNTGCSRLE